MKTISLLRRVAVSGYILFVLMALCSVASAQQPPQSNQVLITGSVYDSVGPILDASVSIAGSDVVVYTSEDGSYSISASSSDVLVFAYPGYASVEVMVGSQLVIDVELSGSVALEEAVINAGYYTVKDREKTGSIYKVTATEIENQPVNNVLDALQGRVPGLEVTPSTGLAGGGYTVRIRGKNSISAGNDPLYVIDGVPFDTFNMSDVNLSLGILPGASINPLNSIDPSSIESIEVLKDADATSIYGSRGANGVILITTKKGKTGKTTFSVESKTTLLSVTKRMDLLNTQEYLKMREEGFLNDGISEYPFNAYDVNGTWDRNRYTDWQEELIGKTAFNNLLRLNISGGSALTKFILGASINKESTVFPKDYQYNKSNFYSSVNHTSKNERLTLQLNLSYNLENNHLPTEDLTNSSLLLPPNAPEVYDDQGNLNWENSTWRNPLAVLETTYRNKTRGLIGGLNLSYKISKWMKFQTNLGYTESNFQESNLSPHTVYDPAWGLTSASSIAFINDTKKTSWIAEPQISSDFNFLRSKVNLIIGSSFQENQTERIKILGIGFNSNYLLEDISSAQSVNILEDMLLNYRYVGFYSRLNIDWDAKYTLNLTARRDGSSRFGTKNLFANFGAVGFAWTFSNENILKDSKILNFGKIRTSYGISGNDQISDYQFLKSYYVNNSIYDNNIGLAPQRLYNPYYAWEKNKKFEIALETKFLNRSLSLELSYYRNRSDNQLVNIPQPMTTGFNSLNGNLDAVVENTGWEFFIENINVKRNKFQWITSFQLSIPRNKLVEFEGLENSTYANSLVIGKPLNIVKLYHFEGINPQTGLFQFTDFNGDGIISRIEDSQYIADLSPNFFGNISNSFQFDNLSIDFMFQFVKKKGFNQYNYFPVAGSMSNQPADVLDHWTLGQQNAHYQMYTSGDNADAYLAHSNFANSQGAISDASFIRLKNVSVSYKFPVRTNWIEGIVFNLQGQNVWTITKFKGGDPEQTFGYLPPLKRFSAGFSIKF